MLDMRSIVLYLITERSWTTCTSVSCEALGFYIKDCVIFIHNIYVALSIIIALYIITWIKEKEDNASRFRRLACFKYVKDRWEQLNSAVYHQKNY